MLEAPRYLLGAAEVLWLAGFAILGAGAARARLLPNLSGAPAHLGTTVLALALLIWPAELLGSFSLLDPLPYLLLVAASGVAAKTLLPRVAWGEGGRGRTAARPQRPPRPTTGPAGRSALVPSLIALSIAAAAILKFGIDLKPELTTGMTGFDSTWYHGPFAAGFSQSGDTWSLHYIAPQFLAWFYPANGEVAHAAGMLAFGGDLLSPLLNLGWLAGCLAACWCLGRPYGVAPWSLALGAVALSLPALADQAGEARNDVVGIFFLLAAVAVALNAYERGPSGAGGDGGFGVGGLPRGAVLVVALAAGLAAGTKLNYLPPAALLVLGAALLAPRGRRAVALALGLLAALAGGGYWYLRNLAHAGNPLPWFTDLGPLTLPGPEQELGGREGHGVLGYLTDGAVWSDWLLPGLREGLTVIWPVLLALALAGMVLALAAGARREGRDGALALAGLTALAAALAWLLAPTSASGPEGMPRGFESGLRYLAPALVLGLALLPAAPGVRRHLASLGARSSLFPPSGKKDQRQRAPGGGGAASGRLGGRAWAGIGAAALLAAVAVGYPVQRHYLENRYASPSFSAPGLDAAFAWARDVHDSRIATTGTRQYPLFGTDLSNEVDFVGEHRPHGGFVAPTTCRAWRRLLDAGEYDYVVATRDRPEEGDGPYPPSAAWTESPQTTEVLRKPPTVVFKLNGKLPPEGCR